MADPIEFEVRADTEPAEAALERLTSDLNRLGDELEDADRAADSLDFKPAAQSARQLAQATESATKALKAKNRAMGLAVNELSEFVGGVTMAIPGTGMLASQIQAAGNNVVGLSASMGPLGIALGLIAGLLPAVISMTRDWWGETETASDKQRKLNDELDQYIALIREAEEAEERRSGRAGTRALEEEARRAFFRASRVRAQAEEEEARLREMAALFDADGLRTEAEAAKLASYQRRAEQARQVSNQAMDELNELQLRLDRMRAEERDAAAADRVYGPSSDLAPAGANVSGDRQGSGGGGRRRQSREPSVAERDRALAAELLALVGERQTIEERLAELRREIAFEADAQAKADQIALQAKMDEAAALEHQLMLLDKLKQAEIDRAAAAAQAVQQREEENKRLAVAQEVTGSIGNTLASTFQIALEGEKNFGDALLESLKTELANIAIRNLYLGLERIATGIATRDPAMFASAAQHFAIAAAAGGAAGGIAAATGGGGGGAPRDEPERDERDQGGGDGGTIVINFNQPATEAQIGRQQEQAARAARRRYGR